MRWLKNSLVLIEDFIVIADVNGVSNIKDRLRSEPCCWCGSMDGERTLEHVIPRSTGGEAGYSNYVGACRSCNSERGTFGILWYMLIQSNMKGEAWTLPSKFIKAQASLVVKDYVEHVNMA